MQWRKGKADEGKTAPEKSQGWKRLKRWLPPSGCNFSVVWFSLTTCGQHGLATTWLEGRGDPRNGKLCSTKQMYPLFHFLRRTQSQIYSPEATVAIMAKVSRRNKTFRVLSCGIIVLRNIWNKVDEEATEWIYSILETKQCNETRKSI